MSSVVAVVYLYVVSRRAIKQVPVDTALCSLPWMQHRYGFEQPASIFIDDWGIDLYGAGVVYLERVFSQAGLSNSRMV